MGLDDQAKQGTVVLEAQTKHQKDYLKSQAEQQKKQFMMQIDMEVKQQEMALEQQSMQLTMEYQQKKAEEEVQKQQYDMEKQQYDMQMKMQKEMEQFQGQGALPFGGLGSTTTNIFNPGMTAAPQGDGQVYTYGPNGELVPKA